MLPDLYSWFEVRPEATADEIKKAWRKRAREFHPDFNPNDPIAEQNFKNLSTAYQILSDPEQRARYDAARRPMPVIFTWTASDGCTTASATCNVWVYPV